MKLIKTINTNNEIIQFYNNQLDGGSKVTMNGKTFWIIRINKNFINSTIKRRKEVNGVYKTPTYKCCRNCNQTKLSEYNFYTSTHNKDGLQNVCKQCVKQKAKQYREELKSVA